MLAETLEDFAVKHTELLVNQAIKGNERAFSQLMSLWYKRIYNFSYKYFADHDTAMEVTQKTFISVHKGIFKLKDRNSFKAWLYRIALNQCREEDRRLTRRSWFSIFDDRKKDQDGLFSLTQHVEEGFHNPEKVMEGKELEEIMLTCLNDLPENQRLVVIMKEYEGLKFREIAEALKISENTAKSRLYYGLKAMKNILDQRKVYKENTYGN